MSEQGMAEAQGDRTYWYNRAEKAERELVAQVRLSEKGRYQEEMEFQRAEKAERERDEAVAAIEDYEKGKSYPHRMEYEATINRVKALVEGMPTEASVVTRDEIEEAPEREKR